MKKIICYYSTVIIRNLSLARIIFRLESIHWSIARECIAVHFVLELVSYPVGRRKSCKAKS